MRVDGWPFFPLQRVPVTAVARLRIRCRSQNVNVPVDADSTQEVFRRTAGFLIGELVLSRVHPRI